MKLTKKIALAGMFLSVGFLFETGIALADEYGLDATAQATFGTLPSRKLPELVGDIVGTGLSFISVIFFILMIYGGFLWMTARGNSDQEGKARDTIFGAVIGIIIVLAAYALTSFVFKSLAPGGGGGGGPSSGSTKTLTGINCKDLSQTYSCMKYTSCTKDVIEKNGYDLAIKDKTSTGLKVETKDGFNYIYGACTGGNENVCCKDDLK